MEHKTIGVCKYQECGEEIRWDENYVRLFTSGEEPEFDIEEFAHLDCYLKNLSEFLQIDTVG